ATGRRSFVKLASNENPLGPPPKALAAARRALAEMHLYPESSYPDLRRALAARHRLRPSQVILGDGSNEILVLAATAFLRRGDNAVMASPSFSVFAHAVTGAGGRPRIVPLRDMRHDLEGMARAVDARTRLVFVCNPNNPTGTIVSGAEVARFLASLPGSVVVVFDEAYAEFVASPRFQSGLKWVRRGLRALVVRTFAKLHGLAGLRIGYGLGPASLVGVLERLRQPFNVNAVAYRAALGALADRAHAARTRRVVAAGRAWLTASLARLGVPCVPSEANFLLAHVGDGGRVAEAMLREGVVVRALPGPVLAPFVRITVGTPSQNRAVIRALAKALPRKV
ncbi:MAG: histidinol-phosphate transaminase, partial [bacterium]